MAGITRQFPCCSFCFITLPFAGLLYGQTAYSADIPEQTLALSDVEVTATASNAQQAQDSAAITTLTHQDLSQSGKRDIGSVLSGYAGVGLDTFSRSYPARLSLRGSTGTLGMLTIDDIPVLGITNNLINLASFPAEAIENATIVRGPSAYRYDNTASGGVIRLSTRDADTDNAFFHMDGGSFDTVSETVGGGSVTGRLGRATVTLNRDDIFTGTNISHSKNNSEKDSAHSTTAISRYSLYPNDRLELNGTLVYQNGRTSIDSFGYDNNLAFLGVVDDTQTFGQNEMWLAQQSATLSLSEHWLSSLQLGFSQQRLNMLIGINEGVNYVRYLPFEFTNSLLLANWRNQHHYSFGTNDKDHVALEWGGGVQDEAGIGQFFGERDFHHRTSARGFVNVDMSLGDWNASAGVHINHYDKLGIQPNYYLGLGWQITPQLKLRGTAGAAYRPPSISELWMPVLGNTPNPGITQGLQAERATSGEWGVDWQSSDALKLSLTGFYSRYHHLIACLPEIPILTATNADYARVQGLEFTWRYKMQPNLNLGSDYTYTDSKTHLDNSRLPLSNVLINSPEHSARFFADWHADQWPISVYWEGIYTSGRHWPTSSPTHPIIGVDDRFIVNAQLGYQFSQNAQVYLRGENLAGNNTPLLPTYGTSGVAVFGGFKVSLF